MRRMLLTALLVGWLLGIATDEVLPELLHERRTVALPGTGATTYQDLVRLLEQDRWRIARMDRFGEGTAAFYQLERPRIRLP